MSDEEEKEQAAVVAAYLRADKEATGRLFWRSKRHPEFVEASLPIICARMPEINGELVLTAHKTRVPQKYGFTLLVGSTRIVGLDVNPAASHFNKSTLTSVAVTHWQWFPGNEADADDRVLSHRGWLNEFCRRTRITLGVFYKAPPHMPVQLDLL